MNGKALSDRRRTPAMATWRSGNAADCKSVNAGSIPAVASNFLVQHQSKPARPARRVR